MKPRHILPLLMLSTVAFGEGPKGVGPPALGLPAPELSAVSLENKAAHLLEMRGKPVVLEFGSATEPVFRAHAASVEKLAKKYGDKVTFLVVYTQEAHAADSPSALELNTDEGFAFAQPTKLEERVSLAKQTAERLGIPGSRMAVDQWNNFTFKTYGAYPNMTYVIDGKGVLQAGYPWMDTGKLGPALDALVAGKAVPSDVRGHTRQVSPDSSEIVNMSLDMTGSRGPQGIGVLLDHFTLGTPQKTALYPAVAQFFADLRQLRGLPAAGAPVAAGETAVTPEEYQKMVEALRASARNLDVVAKGNLPAADYEKLMALVQEGPQMKKFFNADMPAKK